MIGDLLVGFKFIGDRLQNLPKEKNFLFACEESVGYLFNKAYRDKGAETPAVVAAEMAAWCKTKGITPIDLLEEIYQKYGYYAERLYYRLIEGFGAFEQMNLAMAALRKNIPTEIGGRKVIKVIDRLTGEVKDGQTGEEPKPATGTRAICSPSSLAMMNAMLSMRVLRALSQR